MKKRFLLLPALLLLLAGCSRGSSEDAPYTVYCKADQEMVYYEDAVYPAPAYAQGDTDEEIALALLQQVLETSGEGYASAIPSGARVLDFTLKDGQAVVNLSREYASLSGIDLTLADYCITLTLCQLESIDRVSVLVEGRPLPYRAEQSFTAREVLLSHMDEEQRTLRARLYYLDSDTGTLSSETRTLVLYEGQTQAASVLEAWLQGPETETLTPLLPEDITVLSLHVDNGICYVNFEASFLETAPESTESQAQVIEALVRSLRTVSDIVAVQIAVEGEAATAYGSVDISKPLS